MARTLTTRGATSVPPHLPPDSAIGTPDERPSQELWSQLLAEVRQASRDFSANPSTTKLQPGLEPFLGWLQAFRDYLSASPAGKSDPNLIAPAVRVTREIYDIAAGRKSRLFQPVEIPENRPGKSINETDFIAVTALAVEHLHIDGRSLDDAATIVLKAIKDAGHDLAGPRSLSKKQLLAWRNRLRNRHPGAPLAACDRFYLELPLSAGTTAREKADFLLRQIRDAVALKL